MSALSKEAIRREYELYAQIDNPDSNYWMGQAEAARNAAERILGEKEFELWYEYTFGDATRHTWRQICNGCEFARDNPEKALREIECTCQPDGMPCPSCRTRARIRARFDTRMHNAEIINELPF